METLKQVAGIVIAGPHRTLPERRPAQGLPEAPRTALGGQRPHLERLRRRPRRRQEARPQVAQGRQARRRRLPRPREARGPHTGGPRHPHGGRVPDVPLAGLGGPARPARPGTTGRTDTLMTCQSTHNGSVRPDVFPDDFPPGPGALQGGFRDDLGRESPGCWEPPPPPCGDGETRGSDPAPTISSPFRTWPRAGDSDTCFHP